MEEQAVIHSTFVIERTYSDAPERVFAALADPQKKRRWFAEEAMEFNIDFRVGGIRVGSLSHERPLSPSRRDHH